MKIVIINGSGGSGKDTVVELCATYLRQNFHIENISTIDSVKSIARTMGWNGEKDEKGRQFLADLKEAWTTYNNGANQKVMDKVAEIELDEIYSTKDYIIFIHCREPEAILWFKNQCEQRNISVSTLLIKRANIEQFLNKADKNVQDFNYDITMINNGTLQELENKCKILSDIIPYDKWDNFNLI